MSDDEKTAPPSEAPRGALPESPSGSSRRRFLKLAVIAPLAACAPIEEVEADPEDPTPQGPPPLPTEPVFAGRTDDWQDGDIFVIDGFRLAVGRDDDGFWAIGLTCTHLGCNIGSSGEEGEVRWDGLRCGCHGSEYSRNGRVRLGPSVSDLRNFAVEINDDDEVYVDMQTPVSIGTRTR